jgi:hypothetical protein
VAARLAGAIHGQARPSAARDLGAAVGSGRVVAGDVGWWSRRRGGSSSSGATVTAFSLRARAPRSSSFSHHLTLLTETIILCSRTKTKRNETPPRALRKETR